MWNWRVGFAKTVLKCQAPCCWKPETVLQLSGPSTPSCVRIASPCIISPFILNLKQLSIYYRFHGGHFLCYVYLKGCILSLYFVCSMTALPWFCSMHHCFHYFIRSGIWVWLFLGALIFILNLFLYEIYSKTRMENTLHLTFIFCITVELFQWRWMFFFMLHLYYYSCLR